MNAIRSEEQLSTAFEDIVTNGVWSAHYPKFAQVLKEVECVQGRPDFVGSLGDPSVISRGTKEKLVPALKLPSSARILSLLHYAGPRTEEYLLKMSGFSKPVVHRSIGLLESLNLVERTGKGGYVLSQSFPEINWELWAFELKIDHWQRALYQALRYRAFAHRVAVVLPEEWVHRAERSVDLFRSLKIGIIALDAHKRSIRFIVKPRKCSPTSRFHYFFALGKFLCH